VGRFVFMPDSRPDEVDGCVCVEAAGPPGVLRTVQFARGESDEGLDVVAPIDVEGVLVLIRHPPRGKFRAVGFLALFGLALVVSRDGSRGIHPGKIDSHNGFGAGLLRYAGCWK
jgi:hypothetical protein